jgi:hypothetical protein
MSLIGNKDQDQTFTLSSGTVITGYQAVALNTSPTNPDDLEVKLSDSGVTFPIGVAQVDDNVSLVAGDSVAVRTWGVTKAIAAGPITVGAQLFGDATGHVTSTPPGTGRWAIGVALTPASQLGDEILMLLLQEMNEA